MSTEHQSATEQEEPQEERAGAPSQGEAEGGGRSAEGGATDELVTETEELRDRWRRALADLDNQRKRHTKDLARERGVERARTAAAWLPVVDNLELALGHAGPDPSPVVKGVEAVRDQAVDVLRQLGYPRYDETGVPFDPARHEVLGVVDDPDAEPNTVVQVVRPGYGEPGNQLRPASVMVNKPQE